jgi:hypothetical protein
VSQNHATEGGIVERRAAAFVGASKDGFVLLGCLLVITCGSVAASQRLYCERRILIGNSFLSRIHTLWKPAFGQRDLGG